MEELDLTRLYEVPADAITKQEAKEIQELWNSSCVNDYYQYEYDQATEQMRLFAKALQPKGAKFMLKAYEYIYGDFCFVPLDDTYNKTIMQELEKGIAHIRGYLSKVDKGEIKPIKVVDKHAEATTSTNEAQRIKELEEEVQRLREATSTAPTTPEDSPEVQTLREENNRLRMQVENLEKEKEDLRDQLPRNGRASANGLNREERSALLIELLAGVTGIDTNALTGANARIIGQGAKSLGRVCELITGISENQGGKMANAYRDYLTQGGHEKIDETKLQASRTDIKALQADIRNLKR